MIPSSNKREPIQWGAGITKFRIRVKSQPLHRSSTATTSHTRLVARQAPVGTPKQLAARSKRHMPPSSATKSRSFIPNRSAVGADWDGSANRHGPTRLHEYQRLQPGEQGHRGVFSRLKQKFYHNRDHRYEGINEFTDVFDKHIKDNIWHGRSPTGRS